MTFRLGPIGAGVATHTWTASCTFPAGTPINVYEVAVAVAVGLNGYYQGATNDVLLVAAAAAVGVHGAVTLSGA